MRIAVIIPAYNEADLIAKTLDSLLAQSYKAEIIIVVDDGSTDDTPKIIASYSEKHPEIQLVEKNSEAAHLPGSKVVQAFNYGLKHLKSDYDLLCKFDADLIFPADYLKTVNQAFEQNSELGMYGGFCYVERNGSWELENLTNKDHIRGALKCYRKACFEAIGGLKTAMGWDTLDELLAQYHGWEVATNTSLQVKHLKPTGHTYSAKAKYKQGEAFYGMRYGFILTAIASAKLAMRKKSPKLFKEYLAGYFKAQKKHLPFLVTKEEGAFIRKLRWKKIQEKLF
ncbi:glycosyltransferase family 2 protein [Leeuwenhoekiella parthenopeia]|uniref:Glycosyltransferase family 2 protein n=1 Tax=Leeuwenhoekiella parthenopeia TaxID=2890320 RepID=A0ABS8GRE1_9FLAO|nr:glycosyltransferase family 2 protein [Leeuwenhoekiella parthenopeia]MCC4212549.1 glycosyltransferase family 2 protein [Leeuwenhoekiella parthenopeia]